MGSINIAIDGPSGAGKSTISKRLAKQLGFIYIDTGAMYRAIGLYALRKGVGSTDNAAVAALLSEIKIELKHDGEGTQRVILSGEDVSDYIRTPEVSKYASDVSAMPEVRAFLLDLQRSLALKNNVIMDGRDIGTVILPNAQIKIFLTASAEDRAMRRYLEYKQKNMEIEYDEVLKEMISRDKNDSGRALAPLKPAPDAIIVDTTGLSPEDGYNKVYNVIKGRLK